MIPDPHGPVQGAPDVMQLPWWKVYDDNGQINIYGRDGSWIALMPHQCLGSIEAEQELRADFILCAVNHYEALISTLEQIAQHPHCNYDHPDNGPNAGGSYGIGCADGHRCAAQITRAALDLTKAKEGR